LEGLNDHLILKIFVVSLEHERAEYKVQNGAQKISLIVKVTDKEMMEIAKGDKKYVFLRFYKKGFFSTSLIAEGHLETLFSRSNTMEDKGTIGSIQVFYLMKVQKPTRPLITEIMHY
jgi:hypothetical protein